MTEIPASGTDRVLELGFRKELGKTPREFVRDLRLLRAHDELQRANPAETSLGSRAAGFLALRPVRDQLHRAVRCPSRHDAAVWGCHRGSLTGTPVFGQRLGRTGSGL